MRMKIITEAELKKLQGGRKPTHDPVKHPVHYTSGTIECIDAIEAALSKDEFVGAMKFQMIKYVWRSRLKGDTV